MTNESETSTWNIEGIGNRGGYPTSYVATYFEGGIQSRIISAVLKEDLEWVIKQHNRVPGLVKALEQYMAFVDQYEMPTQEQARHLTETVRAALIDAEANDA